MIILSKFLLMCLNVFCGAYAINEVINCFIKKQYFVLGIFAMGCIVCVKNIILI